MSINEIRLKPEQLADLYGQQLIEQDAGNFSQPAPLKLSLLGDFEKKVLILVNEPANAYLSDEGMKLLTGILTACHLNMADVGIVNLNNEIHVEADAIYQCYTPSAWWIFGVDATLLEMEPMNKKGETESYRQAPVFIAPSLDQLANDPVAKRSLWTKLKNHYVG